MGAGVHMADTLVSNTTMVYTVLSFIAVMLFLRNQGYLNITISARIWPRYVPTGVEGISEPDLYAVLLSVGLIGTLINLIRFGDFTAKRNLAALLLTLWYVRFSGISRSLESARCGSPEVKLITFGAHRGTRLEALRVLRELQQQLRLQGMNLSLFRLVRGGGSAEEASALSGEQTSVLGVVVEHEHLLVQIAVTSEFRKDVNRALEKWGRRANPYPGESVGGKDAPATMSDQQILGLPQDVSCVYAKFDARSFLTPLFGGWKAWGVLDAQDASRAAPTLELYDNWWTVWVPNVMTCLRALSPEQGGAGEGQWEELMDTAFRAVGYKPAPAAALKTE